MNQSSDSYPSQKVTAKKQGRRGVEHLRDSLRKDSVAEQLINRIGRYQRRKKANLIADGNNHRGALL